MSAVDAKLGSREVAGRRARDEASSLDRLVETLRLASFRSYLLATVDSMSALVPDVLALAGSDVASASQRIRPGQNWPRITGREAEYGRTGPSFNRRVKLGRKYVTRPTLCMGDEVIAEGALGDWVEARIVGGCLDVTLRSDGYELSTEDGTGYIRFARKLPDTVIAACVGRPVTEVVDHFLLRSRGFIIERAAQVGGASSLVFDVGRLTLQLPWRK